MKIKIKLSIMVISIMVVVVSGISVLLLSQATRITRDLSMESIYNLAQREVKYWEGRESTRLQFIKSLADIMADYEDIPPAERRDRFDSVLFSAASHEQQMLQVYSIWKPNALDGMDNRYIGRPGSSPTGQYAMGYSRESGQIEPMTSIDIDASMAYFNGPNSKKDRVEHPIPRTLGNEQINVIRMMVPIINARTNETVGGVGFLLNISGIQDVLLETIAENDEVALMVMYSSNGFIIGHFIPERIGKILVDADYEYGALQPMAFQAVQDGTVFRENTYDPNLKTMIEFIVLPIKIGNSDTTWSVTIGTTQDFILKEVNEITWFTVLLGLIAIIVTAVIIFLTLGATTKPIVTVANTLKDISEGEGDLTKVIAVKGKDEIS
ncbi:MAG: hypothetical protein FWH41_09865, partial [Treponema sp.]|nr:hypothetical protein [Treponema sp.]